MDSSGRKEKDRKKETLREKFKKETFLIVTYFLLRMIVIVVMVLQARNGNYKNVFLCLLTLLLFTVPSFIEHRLKIDIPNTLRSSSLYSSSLRRSLARSGRIIHYTRDGTLHCILVRDFLPLLSAFLLWICLTGFQAV